MHTKGDVCPNVAKIPPSTHAQKVEVSAASSEGPNMSPGDLIKVQGRKINGNGEQSPVPRKNSQATTPGEISVQESSAKCELQTPLSTTSENAGYFCSPPRVTQQCLCCSHSCAFRM